jgi:cytochrome c1
MCHSMKWQEWELLMDEERREDAEPRTVEVTEREREPAEPEVVRERDPERELVRV